MKYTLFVILILLHTLPAVPYAQTSGANFLLFPVSARAEGMGGAYGAETEDAFSIGTGPAALGALKNNTIGLTYASKLGNSEYQYFCLGQQTEVGNIGAAILFSHYGKINYINATGFISEKIYTAKDFLAQVSIANTYQWLLYGGSIQIISRSLGEFTVNTVCLDAGIGGQFSIPGIGSGTEKRLVATLNIANLGDTLKFESGKNIPLPSMLYLSAQYLPFVNDKHRVKIAFDIGQPVYRSGPPHIKTGLEYRIYKIFNLRAGYQSLNNGQAGTVILGGGLEAPVRKNTFAIDYAWYPYSMLNDNGHSISALLRFKISGSSLKKNTSNNTKLSYSHSDEL